MVKEDDNSYTIKNDFALQNHYHKKYLLSTSYLAKCKIDQKLTFIYLVD